jgi:hypothetical protein
MVTTNGLVQIPIEQTYKVKPTRNQSVFSTVLECDLGGEVEDKHSQIVKDCNMVTQLTIILRSISSSLAI